MAVDPIRNYVQYQNYSGFNNSLNDTFTQQYRNMPLYDFNLLNYNSPTDSVSFSGNTQTQFVQKQGLSTGEKVAIGTGIATAIAIGADFLFCKGKHVKNLLGKFKTANVKPEVKPEIKLEVKPELKPYLKPQTKVEVKPKLKTYTKPETKVEVKPDVKPETTVQPATKVKPEVKPELKHTNTPEKPVMTNAPEVFEGSQVPMHHNLSGSNPQFREAYRAVTSSKTIDADDMFDVTHGLPRMFKVDKEFAKLPPLEKDCIVWRGRSENPVIERLNQDFKIIDNAQVGDIIVPDTGYSYTAFKKELANIWSSPIEGRTLMYKIHLPKGAKVSRNLEHGGEVVIPRNAEYRLLSKTQNGKHMEVELEYIIPKKDNVAEIEEFMKKFNIQQSA